MVALGDLDTLSRLPPTFTAKLASQGITPEVETRDGSQYRSEWRFARPLTGNRVACDAVAAASSSCCHVEGEFDWIAEKGEMRQQSRVSTDYTATNEE